MGTHNLTRVPRRGPKFSIIPGTRTEIPSRDGKGREPKLTIRPGAEMEGKQNRKWVPGTGTEIRNPSREGTGREPKLKIHPGTKGDSNRN